MSWINEAIIYQINLRSLAAREPRNAFEAASEQSGKASPLAYVTRNLSVIAELGVTVVYLLPPYPIGVEGRKGIGSPYSSRDFMAVEPEYGTLEELKAFVARAHALDLKVIFDITPNHTSRDHVWTKSNPEFYVRDDKGDLFYDFDWSDVAKLNYQEQGLRRAMIGVYDFWLSILGEDNSGVAQGIDGFRLDMAHMISDLSFWDEAMATLRSRHAQRELLFLAECYGTENNMGLFRRGINAAYDDDFYKVCQNAYTISDTPVPPHPHTPILPHSDTLLPPGHGIAAAFEQVLMRYEEALGLGGAGPWLARYTDNHDEGRGVYRFGDGAVRAVMQLVFLAPHTIPFLLTGQEFGALNRPSIHERFGPCDKGRRVCTPGATGPREPLEGERLSARESSGGRAYPRAVAPENVREDPGIEFEGNLFARGREARQAWYEFYRGLIRLRRRHRVLREGDFTLVDAGEGVPQDERTVIAFGRCLGRKALRCAVNLGPEPRRVTLSLEGQPLYGALADGCLPPFSAIVRERISR